MRVKSKCCSYKCKVCPNYLSKGSRGSVINAITPVSSITASWTASHGWTGPETAAWRAASPAPHINGVEDVITSSHYTVTGRQQGTMKSLALVLGRIYITWFLHICVKIVLIWSKSDTSARNKLYGCKISAVFVLRYFHLASFKSPQESEVQFHEIWAVLIVI